MNDSSTWITDLSPDRPVALLLRHAEREPIEKLEDTVAAALTPAGLEQAENLGRALGYWPRLTLQHSPVGRCRQTAEAIAAGARAAGCPQVELAGPQTVLGGPYMLDWRTVMTRVLEQGAGGFVREWFTGELAPGLVRDARAAAREQLDHLRGQLAAAHEPALYINVSHDWNLLLVRFFYLERGERRFGWPEYLEALALYRQDGHLWLQREQSRQPITDED